MNSICGTTLPSKLGVRDRAIIRLGGTFGTRTPLHSERRGMLSTLRLGPERDVGRLAGDYTLGGYVRIIGTLLSGKTLFINRAVLRDCEPGDRTRIHLYRTCHSTRTLGKTLNALGHTPGRRGLLLGLVRLTRYDRPSCAGRGRIAHDRLLGRDNVTTTVLGTLVTGNVMRVCVIRVKHLSPTIASTTPRLAPLDPRRRATFRRVHKV